MNPGEYVQITSQGYYLMKSLLRLFPQMVLNQIAVQHIKLAWKVKILGDCINLVDEPAVLDGLGGLVVDQQSLSCYKCLH